MTWGDITAVVGLLALVASSGCQQASERVHVDEVDMPTSVVGWESVARLSTSELVAQTRTPGSRPLVVHFWSSWCEPCRQEWADVQDVLERFSGQVDFVLVSVDSERSAGSFDRLVSAPEQTRAATLPHVVVWDGHDADALSAAMGSGWQGELPATYVYASDRAGRRVFLEPTKADALAQSIASLL